MKLLKLFIFCLVLTANGTKGSTTIDNITLDSQSKNNFEGLTHPQYVSSGYSHTCVIDDEGVKCWGNNRSGQTEVPKGIKNPKAVSAGLFHTCAIDDDGVKCWGNNSSGQTEVPKGIKNPKAVSAGLFHTCAIDDDVVKCWGR